MTGGGRDPVPRRPGESGGGSGLFRTVLFLRIETRPALDDGRRAARDLLVRLGSETLGDRAPATLALAGDTVTIRKRAFRGAAGPGPTATLDTPGPPYRGPAPSARA